jgi:hypothetical protein
VGNPSKVESTQSTITWKISSDWLQRADKEIKQPAERVESMAVNNDCLQRNSRNDIMFAPDEVGCVVVGTSTGRVVQLRRHLTKKRSLVPERAMQLRDHAVSGGSLHVLKGGIVMTLRPAQGTVQALDTMQGSLVGEWRLPQDIEWCSLCGGGGNLYILGKDRGSATCKALWRFPVPPELAALSSRRDSDDDADSSASDTEM